MATSRVAERLDAPRNKISGLTGVPPLRRFFNHPSDVPLREIIQARDILIVDANMGAIGTENSKACMLFILRMLHAQLQRQVHLPEAERPRVPLLVDEAHYVAGGENVVDQIATHRAAGLEAAFGLQYFAQLGSASEHQQKILKGVLNLLQSRFLFRMGDAEDAEQATRIAMAVYATMIRDDPDSRARLRVTPEQALNFPNYYCLASWIANGTRAPSFMGQTYPLPDVGDEWAEHHLAAQDERVGPYPEQLESTLADRRGPDGGPPSPADDAGGERSGTRGGRACEATDRRSREPAPTAARAGEARGPGRLRAARSDGPPTSPTARSAASSDVRISAAGRADSEDRQPSDTLRELAFLDRINEIGPADQLDGADSLPRLYDEDYAILALLDRVGLAPASLIGRAALPGRAPRSVGDRLIKLYRHGLIARHTTGLRSRSRTDGKPPWLHSLTRRGLQVAQDRQPAPAISAAASGEPIEQPRAGRLVARPARARLGDRVPPARRRAGRPTTGAPRATPPAATRSRRSAPGSAGTRSRSTRSRSPTGRRSSTSGSRRSPRSSPTSRSSSASTQLKLTFDLLVEIDLTATPRLQPRQVPRLRRVPLRLVPRPPPLQRPGHPTGGRVRERRQPRRARLRPRGRRADDRTDRRHGHARRALVLRRTRPHLLRRRGRDPPRRPAARSRFRRTRPGCASGSTAGATWRSTG